MRKTKENLALASKFPDQDIRDAQETANEEKYEAIGGESSSEGVGIGYDADEDDATPEEKAEASADGPLSRDASDPPMRQTRKKRKTKHGIHPANSRSNHAAANSSKTI
jgi:hypothetical protein